MTPKLIVAFNKKFFKRTVRILFIQFLIQLALLFFLKSFGWQLIFKYLIGIHTVLMIPSLFYMYKVLHTSEPAAILSEEGLWIRGYGSVPWNNISEFDMPYIMNFPTETIIVGLKTTKSVFAQAGFYEKINFVWAKIFGYTPVRLSNLDLPCQTVIDFAQQFLHNKSGHAAN